MKNKTSKGFTLIELLIVITIIGILAVAFLPSVLGAPAKARDVARKGHLNQIATAIEAYGLTGQAYPGNAASGGSLCVNKTDLSVVVTQIAGGNLPKDPSNTDLPSINSKDCPAGEYLYIKFKSNSQNLNYALVAQMEDVAAGNAALVAIPTNTATTFTAATTGQYYVLIK